MSPDKTPDKIRCKFLAGDYWGAIYLFGSLKKQGLPDYLFRAVEREVIPCYCAVGQIVQGFEIFNRLLAAYPDEAIDVWFSACRAVASTLQPAIVENWLAATATAIRNVSPDKIRVDRYIVILRGLYRFQLSQWDLLSNTDSEIIRVNIEDLEVTDIKDNNIDIEKILGSTAANYLNFWSLPVNQQIINRDTLRSELHSLQLLGWNAENITQSVDHNTACSLAARNSTVVTLEDQRSTVVYQVENNPKICSCIINEHSLIGFTRSFFKSKMIDINEMIFVAQNAAPGNHYHEMMDTFASIYIYKYLKLDCKIVVSKINKKYLPLYAAVGIQEDFILEEKNVRGNIYSLIIAPPSPGINKVFADFVRNAVKLVIKSHISDGHEKTRIYISRSKSRDRRLTNETELENLLEKLGFTILYFEEMSLESQLHAMNMADIVVSPHGAGLTNAVGCKAGSTIVELLSPDYPADTFCRLAMALGLKYKPFVGSRMDEKGNWAVNISELLLSISKIQI